MERLRGKYYEEQERFQKQRIFAAVLAIIIVLAMIVPLAAYAL